MNSISAWSVLSLASFILTGCSGSSVAITPTPPPPPASVVDTAFASQATVGRLYLDGEAQLAGTSEGLFWRANAQADWQQRSPTTAHVNAVAVIAPGHYIVAMKPAGSAPHTEPSPLYVTQDSGANWQSISHNFGRDNHTTINNLAYDLSTGALYAVGATAVAVADSTATNWMLLEGEWDGFATGIHLLELQPAQQNLWFGGQGAIENGFLSRYFLPDGTLTTWTDLFPNPSAFKGGLIHPTDSQTVLFGGEGGIAVSRNNGESWELPLGDVNHRFYWDIVIDDAGVLYTAGYDKSGPEQPLIVECSSDNATTWHSNDFADEVSKGGVRSLAMVDVGGDSELYLGLWENGIKSISTADLNCG